MANIALLDDYQNVALSMADWSPLRQAHQIKVFNEPIGGLDALARALAGFEVIGIMRERTPFQRALFEKLPQLKLLVTTGKRNASVDLEAARAHGVTVCGTGGGGLSTAELAIGLMLAFARNLREEFQTMRPGGGWQTTLGFDLDGKTLGMQLIAWSQNLTEERARQHGAQRVGKDELFRRADVISIHSVLSARTRGLIGAPELGLMKPSALLVNTSRGPIVDTVALLAALREKRIAGYAADTFDVEPLPADQALRSEPRALLTPHLGYVTAETYRSFYGGMVASIEAWLADKPIGVLT